MRCFLWRLTSLCLAVSIASTQSDAALNAAAGGSSGVNVANVPDCAKLCLSNSTQYATDCAQIDVKCLCSSPSYVSALSCCLATNCNGADQQTAIKFNVQECAAVNSTAPNFVGCSPFSLTTGAGGSRPSTSSSSNPDVSTLATDRSASIPTAYSNTKLGTATFNGNAILTGSCTVPLFAEITETSGNVLEFPQVGCALNRGECCPYAPDQYLGLTKCPADHTTTAGACCPSGYVVYNTAIGAETPCVSRLTRAYVPASTVSGEQMSIITDSVFSRRYTLVSDPQDKLSGGAVTGIVIGAVLAAAGTPAFLILLLRSMKKHKAKRELEEKQAQSGGAGVTFPSTEPALDSASQINEADGTPAPSYFQSTHEIASPQQAMSSPAGTMKGMPAAFQRTPTYEMPVPVAIPLEMPGSTYMHEHHPAYGSESGLRGSTTTSTPSIPGTPPRSPPQTPSAVSPGSPMLSPSSPYRAHSPNNLAGFNITPLGSPRFREGTM